MRSWRVLLREVAIDGVAVEASYADLFVVRARGRTAGPGPTTGRPRCAAPTRLHLRPGRHELRAHTADGHELIGWAMLRFSDGHQHLFRGDGDLTGVAAVIADPTNLGHASPARVAQLVDAEGLNPSGLARAMRVRPPPRAPQTCDPCKPAQRTRIVEGWNRRR